MTSTTVTTPSKTFTVKGTGFQFTAPPAATLIEGQYTLATNVEDLSGSVWPFRGDLFIMNERAAEMVKEGSGKNTTLLRSTAFSDRFPHNVKERHGFLPAMSIDPAVHFAQLDHSDYGNTPLYAGVMEALLTTEAEAKRLIDEVGVGVVNASIVISTDGMDNIGGYKPEDIRRKIEEMQAEAFVESITTLLIGINVDRYRNELEDFKQKAGLTKFIDFADADKTSLGRAARIISSAHVSQSQNIGNKGPSRFVQGLTPGTQAP